jgi:hypothetical protein
MIEASPEDPAWLAALAAHSPLIPESAQRAHWQRLIPLLPTPARYELAAALLDVEHWLGEDCPAP